MLSANSVSRARLCALALAAVGVAASPAAARGPTRSKNDSISLSTAKPRSTLSLAFDGPGTGFVVLDATGAATAEIKVMAESTTLLKRTVKVTSRGRRLRRTFPISIAKSRKSRGLRAQVTLKRGRALRGRLVLSYLKASGALLRRMAKAKAKKVEKKPAPKPMTAVVLELKPTAVAVGSSWCPRDGIVAGAKMLLGDVGGDAILKSEFVKHERERSCGGGFYCKPYPGRARPKYRPQFYESRGFLHLDDVNASSKFTIEKKYKELLLNAILRELDCPWTIWKNGRDTGRSCKRGDTSGGCQASCARASGFVYAEAVDTKAAQSKVLQGVLFGAACTSAVPTNRGHGLEFRNLALSSTFGVRFRPLADIEKDDGVRKLSDDAKRTIPALARLWQMPILVKAINEGYPTIQECRDTAHGEIWGKARRVGMVNRPEPEIPRGCWSVGWDKIQCSNPRDLDRYNNDVRAWEQERARSALIVDEIARFMQPLIDNVCKCPTDRRVNLHITDRGSKTEIRFHVGWYTTRISERAIPPFMGININFGADVVAGFLEPQQMTVETAMTEESLADRSQSLYQRANDPKPGEPFGSNGLFHLDDECLAYALKPRLDALYGCGLDSIPHTIARGDLRTVAATLDGNYRCASSKVDKDQKRCAAKIEDWKKICKDTFKTQPGKHRCCDGFVDGSNKLTDALPATWGPTHRCRDQLRKAMILNHETPYFREDQSSKQTPWKIMDHCLGGGAKKDDVIEKVEDGKFRIPSGCADTLRAAVYRGDMPKCTVTRCENRIAYGPVPAGVPRAAIALENLKHRNRIQVHPPSDRSIVALRIRFREKSKGALKLHFYYRFTSTDVGSGRRVSYDSQGKPSYSYRYDSYLDDEEWVGPWPIQVRPDFDIVATPYALVPEKHLRRSGFAQIGAELSTDPQGIDVLHKGDLVERFCKEEFGGPVLSRLCTALGTYAFVKAARRMIPTQIQWMMSGVVLNFTRPELFDLAKEEIASSIAKTAASLTSSTPFAGLFDKGKVARCVKAFLDTGRLTSERVKEECGVK